MEIVDERKYITKDEYDKIKDTLEKSQESTEPFLVVDDDGKELSVVGDANDTKKKIKSYDVLFRFPKFVKLNINDNENTKVIKEEEVGSYVYKTIQFTNVFLAPRNDLKIVREINAILPYFNKMLDDGNLDNMSDEEVLALLANANDELIDGMYNVVKVFLGLDEGFEDFILPSSIIITFNELIQDFPAVFNEADVFFG